jgi:aryl-alcohol dehydrogenase
MHKKFKPLCCTIRAGRQKTESLELEGPRDDEVLVRMVATGICRTDIDSCDNWDEASQPVALGHEGAGVTARAGRKANTVKRGDHVSEKSLTPI